MRLWFIAVASIFVGATAGAVSALRNSDVFSPTVIMIAPETVDLPDLPAALPPPGGPAPAW